MFAHSKHILLCTVAIGLFVVQQAGAQALDSPIERSFNVSTGGDLVVDVDRGSIEVESTDGREVDVRIEREGTDDFLRRMKFEVRETSNGVSVVGEYDGEKRWGWRNGKRNKVRVRVLVPRKYNVDLKTSGGSIEVQDLDGSVDAKTSGGHMTFGLIDGPIVARTSGGSITLEGSSGPADVKTSGGSINLGDVGGNVVAQTSGGSIKLDRVLGEVDASTSGGRILVKEVRGTINARTSGGSIEAFISEQPKGDCSLTTSGGSVKVALAPDVRVDIEAKSSGGSVRTDIPMEVVGEVKRTRMNGTVNGGGPLLKLRTSGGGVRIVKA